MKNIKQNITKIILSLLVLTMVTSCGEMLENPTIDKDTGEDISFLIVDFNFFTTRATYKFIDVSDNSTITKQARIWFTGANANDIVNFAGIKNEEYTTKEGKLELTFDPNIEVSESSPLEFSVHIEIDGYETFAQGIQINNEGKKTFELKMSKETSTDDVLTGSEDPNDDGSFVFSLNAGTKSATTQPYQINYSIKKSDLIKCKDFYGREMFASIEEANLAYESDPDNFIKLIIGKNTDFPQVVDRVSINGSSQLLAFQKLETGILQGIVITGRNVTDLNGGAIQQYATYTDSPTPDIFGFAQFEDDNWLFSGTTQTYYTLDFSYTLAKASTETLCNSGSTIQFTSNMVSSFSIDAVFYNTEGNEILTENFTGSFPETFTLENVPSGSANVVFKDNNPAFQQIPDLSISDLCSGDYEVEVLPTSGYEGYQIVLKALCTENTAIAFAPTYSAEYRIKDSNDEWQVIDMIGGIANIMAIPDKTYELRLLWEDKWETTAFSTAFDESGNYINLSGSNVKTEVLGDSRIRFRIEHTFEQSICDEMGW